MSTTPTQAASSLEFNCTSCQRTLKVAASAAGKRAACPQCGAIVQVPAAAPPASGPSVAPLPSLGPSLSSGPAMDSAGGDIRFTGSSTPLAPPLPPNYSQPQGFGPPQPPAYSQPQSYAPQPRTYAPQPGYSPSPLAPMHALHQPPQPQAPAPQRYQGRDTPTKQLFDRLTKEIAKIYVGQDELVLGTLVAMFSSGHVLIESVPGLGKTLFVRTLGKVLGCQFGRIQFTADLMPSDVTGAPVLDMKTQEFRFRPGPIFTQLLLADEINRAPAKTHAALLEVMQEYRVTVDGKSHVVDRPFLVLATQNPIESEGTYNLPEAQLDRFMFKLVANYPREQEESTILKLHSQQVDVDKRLELELETICNPTQIMQVIHDNAQIRVDEKLVDYINKIVRLTRGWPQFHMGASPRAGIALMQASRTLAAFQGRDYAVPDDVAQIVLPALRHRVMLTAEAEVEGQKVDDLLTELVRSVEVPRI